MMQNAKLDYNLGFFVRETCLLPQPVFILACGRQLNDLVRYCAAPNTLVHPYTVNLGTFPNT